MGLTRPPYITAGLKTSVIGVPKTIDGDLKSLQVATSLDLTQHARFMPR